MGFENIERFMANLEKKRRKIYAKRSDDNEDESMKKLEKAVKELSEMLKK